LTAAGPSPRVDGSHAEPSGPRVSLMRVDAGLRAAVPPAELPSAERLLTAPLRELPPGPGALETLFDDVVHPFGALLLRGVVTSNVAIAGRRSAHLLGPGDVLRPWRSADTTVPCASSWTAAGGAEVAVLDDRFLMGMRRWPRVGAVIFERLAEQVEAGAVRTAIVALPRVEQRVLAMFWQLADRWGVVRPDGVVIRLALTHELIGWLTGAQRPTVSLALHTLADQGLLRRDETGAWILGSDSRAELAVQPAPRFGPASIVCARPVAQTARR